MTSEGYIQVKGGKVWYRISGQDKDKTPLIALHGGPGAPHYCLEPLEALSNERPVILYDQLGCGKSDRPRDKSLWTIGHFTEELDQIRNTLGLKKAHILGHSWGTMIAVDYMLTRKPQGVVSLILSGPCLSASLWYADCRRYISEMGEKEKRVILHAESTGNFKDPQYQETVDLFYKSHLCRLQPWPDCIKKTFGEMGVDVYESMWGPSEFTISGTLKSYERAHNLKEIKTPALFTCGRYDEASPESTKHYHEMMPGSEYVVFEDASHMHHLEKTDQYIQRVRLFLDRENS